MPTETWVLPRPSRSKYPGSFPLQGHSYAVFRRALERRSVAAAWAAAADLPRLSLADALALCLLLRDHEPHRYGRAAVRWLARFCDEEAGVDLDEAVLVAVHLATFRAPGPLAPARAFAELLEARGRRELAQAVRRWEVELAAGATPVRAPSRTPGKGGT